MRHRTPPTIYTRLYIRDRVSTPGPSRSCSPSHHDGGLSVRPSIGSRSFLRALYGRGTITVDNTQPPTHRRARGSCVSRCPRFLRYTAAELYFVCLDGTHGRRASAGGEIRSYEDTFFRAAPAPCLGFVRDSSNGCALTERASNHASLSSSEALYAPASPIRLTDACLYGSNDHGPTYVSSLSDHPNTAETRFVFVIRFPPDAGCI
ncbi:hypothetical protein C8R45DRAFT_1026790, partial [Mycena sanguinolenta]